MLKKYSTITSYIWITIGTVLLSAGVYFFKIPNGFVTGGVGGVGILLSKISANITAGQWILIINVLLLIIGFVFLGSVNGFRTVYCSMLFSLLTYVFEFIFPLSKPMTDQPLLELVYAMLLTSVGSAIIFNNDSSSGGTDIIALILKKYTSLNVGKALLLTDFIISSLSFFEFGLTVGLYSLLGLFSKAFLVDVVIDNINACKYFVVVTEEADKIQNFIMEKLHHGVTVVDATGGYTNRKKVMIHTVCKRLEAIRLRKEIKEIDRHAFIIVSTTSEIIGRGFRGV